MLFLFQEELQNWDSWGDDGGGLTGVKVEPADPHQQENDETEPDFFADMTPNFKKAVSILNVNFPNFYSIS